MLQNLQVRETLKAKFATILACKILKCIHTLLLFFRECNKMMERSKFSEEEQKSHFETGVKMGVGTFNLVSTGQC